MSFDHMREKIYTEVATFISMNEARPVYLLNLFKQLQNLRDNQSRYRALKNIYDIGNGLRTDDDYDDDNDIVIATRSGSQQQRRVSTATTASTQSSQSYQNHAYNIKRKYQTLSHAPARQQQQHATATTTDTNDSDYMGDDTGAREEMDDSVEKKFYYSWEHQDDDSSTNRTTTPFESDSLSNTVIFLGSHPNSSGINNPQEATISRRLDLPNCLIAKNINQSSLNTNNKYVLFIVI
jgi:hypothetical protein